MLQRQHSPRRQKLSNLMKALVCEFARCSYFRPVFWLTDAVNLAALGWIAVEGGAPLEMLEGMLDAVFTLPPH